MDCFVILNIVSIFFFFNNIIIIIIITIVYFSLNNYTLYNTGRTGLGSAVILFEIN